MPLVDPLEYAKKEEKTFNHIVAYMDLDAFYASVEIQKNPSLAGLPLIVGGDPQTKKGVVATCSYEARKFGVYSGMPIIKALKLCPKAKIVNPSYKLYSKKSRRIMDIIKRYAPRFKIRSIDEAYLDFTNIVSNYENAKKLAIELKDDIYGSEGLTCSIGIAPNIILAKIASGINKPNALTIVKPSEIKSFLSPLSINRIPGVGKKTTEYFNNKRIHTCGDLAAFDPSKKDYAQFLSLWKLTNGLNTQDVESKFLSSERKSISDEKTFFNALSSWEQVLTELHDSINTIVTKAHKKRFLFKTITLKIRFRDFKTETRSHSVSCNSSSQTIVEKTIQELLNEYKNIKINDIRLLGVKISNLTKIAEKQLTLTQFFKSDK